jgi:hypothetical protein
MTNTEILNQALDAYEKENDLFDRKKFDDIQILSVVFKAMDLVNNLNIPVVSQQRELLSWMKKNHHLAKTEEQINEMLLDYNFSQLNCG